MEDWERKHISRNLPELMRTTFCNSMLLAKLHKEGLITLGEIDILSEIKNSEDQAMQFYRIIQTRSTSTPSTSFNLLKQALADTDQSGALAILDKCTQWDNSQLIYHGAIGYNDKHILGRGSNGTRVCKGKFHRRDVAVKIISVEYIDNRELLASKEIDFLKLLDWHSNVVRYFEMERMNGVGGNDLILIALELCDMDLHNWVVTPRHERKIIIHEVEVIKQATAGLVHLHSYKVAHRDLKPLNILMVSQATGHVLVKISDFGMAKMIATDASRMSEYRSEVGTMGWMAPEVIDNTDRGMGLASDIFSLGCIFYFVLTGGKHPFGVGARGQLNILNKTSEIYQEKITTLLAGTLEFTPLIKNMIADNPAERPSAFEVLRELHGHANPDSNGCRHRQSKPETLHRICNSEMYENGMRLEHDTRQTSETGKRNENSQDQVTAHDSHDIQVNPTPWPGLPNLIFSLKGEDTSEEYIPRAIQDQVPTNADEKVENGTTLTSPQVQSSNPEIPTSDLGIDKNDLNAKISFPKTDTLEEERIKEIIRKDANLSGGNADNPLHLAVKFYGEDKNTCWKIIKHLIENGANVYKQDILGDTFLHASLRSKPFLEPTLFSEIVNYLVAKKYTDIFSVPARSKTPFHLAVLYIKMEEETIRIFQGNGVNFNKVDLDEYNVLFHAVSGNQSPNVLSTLIQCGARWDHLGKGEQSLLHHVCRSGSVESLEFLLELGLDVNAKERSGDTPLHWVLANRRENSFELIKILVEKRADVNVRNKHGKTTWALALSTGDTNIITFLNQQN